jgi:hypothetical protein
MPEEVADWREYAAQWTQDQGLQGTFALLVAGPSVRNPLANHRLEFLQLHSDPPA